MTPEFLGNILSDQEKDKLQAFLEDKTMSEAVRKVLLAGIYYNGTLEAGKVPEPNVNFILSWPFMIDLQNADVSDASIGQDVRASVRGIRLVEMGFAHMAKLIPQVTNASGKKPNRAL